MLDVAYFSNQFADREGHGLARYSRELFEGLRRSAQDVAVQPIAAWSSLERDELTALQGVSGLRLLPWGRRLTPLLWTFPGGPPIERWLPDAPDVVHAVSLGYPVTTRKPLVVTIHDLGPLTHPEYFPRRSLWIMKKSLDQALRQADAIICVSHSTADQLLSIAGSGVGDRVRVIHEGVSKFFFEPPEAGCLQPVKGLPEVGTPYILCTGKLSPRKKRPRACSRPCPCWRMTCLTTWSW